MRLFNCFLAALALLVVNCGGPPSVGTTQQAEGVRPPGVYCAPSTWTPSATVPPTGSCLWAPSPYLSPMPYNLRMCDVRIPPQQGEVELYDLPWVGSAAAPTSHCGVLNWSAGGYFDWLSFQYYGWQTLDGTSIRALRLGPNTRVVWGDRPFDSNPAYLPSQCNSATTTCISSGFGPLGVTFGDVWHDVPAWSGKRMASIWIGHP